MPVLPKLAPQFPSNGLLLLLLLLRLLVLQAPRGRGHSLQVPSNRALHQASSRAARLLNTSSKAKTTNKRSINNKTGQATQKANDRASLAAQIPSSQAILSNKAPLLQEAQMRLMGPGRAVLSVVVSVSVFSQQVCI